MCKSWCELIIAIVVIVFALWQTSISQWIVVIAGIILLIHSFSCKNCFCAMEMPEKNARASRRK